MAFEKISENIYKGIKWTTFQQWGQFGIHTITTVILANILMPDDFGMIISASIPIGLMIIFQEMSIGSVIIRKKNLSKNDINSFFTLLIGFATLLSLITFFIAPLYVSYFTIETENSAKLITLIRVLVGTILLTNLFLISNSLMQRNLNFQRLSFNMIFSMLISSILAIVLAKTIGVWALVVRQTSMIMISGLLNWRYLCLKVKVSFDMKCFMKEWDYIKSVSSSQILVFVARNLDYLIIGKFLGANALGQYGLAYKLLVFPVKSLSGIMTKILFPILNKLMPDIAMVRKQYFESIRLISLFIFPMMFFISGMSVTIVKLFFDSEKWGQLPALILIAGIFGAIQATTSPIGILYKLQEKPSSYFQVNMLSVVIVGSAYLIGVQWGLIEAVLLHAIMWVIISFPVANIMIFKKINAHFFDFLKLFRLPLLFSVILFIILRFSTELIWYDLTIIGFITTFCISILFYSLFLRIFKINLWDTIKSIVKA